jgi:hypothetical protein
MSEKQPTAYSYFLENILPHLITLAIALCIWIVASIFDLTAFSSTAKANEDDFVRKDTQTLRDSGQDKDIENVKDQLSRLEQGQNTMLKYFMLPIPKKE